MRTSSTAVDSYHLRVMVERLQHEGRSEQEIVAAVEEADDTAAIRTDATGIAPVADAPDQERAEIALGSGGTARLPAGPGAARRPRRAGISARQPHSQLLEPRQHFLGEVRELARVVDEAQRHPAEARVPEALDLGGDIVG